MCAVSLIISPPERMQKTVRRASGYQDGAGMRSKVEEKFFVPAATT